MERSREASFPHLAGNPETAWRVGGGEGGAPVPQPPRRPGRRGHGGWGARRGRGGHAVGLRAEGGPGGCSGSTPTRWGHRARSCPPASHPFSPVSCSCPVSQRSWSLALGGQNIRFRSSSSVPPPPASVSLSVKRVGGSWSLPPGYLRGFPLEGGEVPGARPGGGGGEGWFPFHSVYLWRREAAIWT